MQCPLSQQYAKVSRNCFTSLYSLREVKSIYLSVCNVEPFKRTKITHKNMDPSYEYMVFFILFYFFAFFFCIFWLDQIFTICIVFTVYSYDSIPVQYVWIHMNY